MYFLLSALLGDQAGFRNKFGVAESRARLGRVLPRDNARDCRNTTENNDFTASSRRAATEKYRDYSSRIAYFRGWAIAKVRDTSRDQTPQLLGYRRGCLSPLGG